MKNTKQKIMETMYSLVATLGYDKASIGRICEEIGISKPSVYHYFKNKEEILISILEDDLRIAKEVVKDITQAKDAKEYKQMILNFGYEIIDLNLKDKHYLLFNFQIKILSTRIESIKTKLIDSETAYRKMFYEALEKGVELGAFEPDFNIALYSELLNIVIDGMEDAILKECNADIKAVWSTYINSLFKKQI